jgi:hypothetical protein
MSVNEEKGTVAATVVAPKDDSVKANQRVKHITQEGARFHVISWDSNGRRCSEPMCEVNYDK